MITIVAETGSTNADLLVALAKGERPAEGDWLVTDRQSAGRGRQGRAWFDGAGNFMGSTVVYAGASDPPLHTVALIAGLALHTVIARLLDGAGDPRLKWPNDLMIGRAKLAGILLERAADAVVVGIGVNLACAPQIAGRETAALVSFGPIVYRDVFAGQLAAAFAGELDRWRREGLAPTIARWCAAAHPPGTPLLVGEPGEAPLTGEFYGLGPDGALIITLLGGTRQTIHAGEVRLGPQT